MKAKYSIQDEDTYNFDEAGFMMGMISTGAVVTGSKRQGQPMSVQPGNQEWTTVIQGVNATGWAIPPFMIFQGKHHLSAWYKEDDLTCNWVFAVSENGWTTNKLGLQWLKHFDAHTTERTVGGYCLLIMDGHNSHNLLKFQQYCKENNIITLCMPPHLSHLLQPLDVGCFAPLKIGYGRQAENLMHSRINHITKLEFLPCFKAAFNAAITKDNILERFQGAGLVPYNPGAVILKLDIRLCTPLLPTSEDEPWQLQTPSNILEFGLQSNLIQERIQRHVNSLPTSTVNALERLSKGAEMAAHQLVLVHN
jgi:hypothetical protein